MSWPSTRPFLTLFAPLCSLGLCPFRPSYPASSSTSIFRSPSQLLFYRLVPLPVFQLALVRLHCSICTLGPSLSPSLEQVKQRKDPIPLLSAIQPLTKNRDSFSAHPNSSNAFSPCHFNTLSFQHSVISTPCHFNTLSDNFGHSDVRCQHLASLFDRVTFTSDQLMRLDSNHHIRKHLI